jgi:hypothetical protein
MNGILKMDGVKLNCSFTGEVFNVKFCEKFDKSDVKQETVILKEVSFNCTELPANIYISCASSQHGIKQKMADSLALTGELKKTTSINDCIKILTDLWAQLKGTETEAGSWTATTRANSANTLKIDKAGVNSKLAAMPEAERLAAIAKMKELGINF